MARSRVLGDFKLRKMLRQFPEQVEANLKPAMRQGSEMILSDMQRLIPVDSGAGKNALTAFVAKSGLDAQVGLRGKRKRDKFYYLGFIEYGTKGTQGERRNDGHPRSKKQKTDGAHWFGRYPDIPARPAHPFVRPALHMNRAAVVELLNNAIKATLSAINNRSG